MAQSVIGAERLGKLKVPKDDRLKETAPSSFLLPSSLHGPPSPSPSIYQEPFNRSVVVMNRPLDRFRFSATSEAFTPTRTCPGTPTAADSQTVIDLQQELIDSIFQVNLLSDDLRDCRNRLKAKMGENFQLRNYINTLHGVIEDKCKKSENIITSGASPSKSVVSSPLSPASPGSTKAPSDAIFKEEFGMLFREIHNFGKGFYKFPTEASIPGELRETMKDIVGDELVAFNLLNDYHTKLLVVAGIVTRFLCLEIFRFFFLKNIVMEMGLPVDLAMQILHEYCCGQGEAVTKALSIHARVLASEIHSFLLPLMSRPGDQKHCEESFRLLDTLVEHASRLWLQITSFGADNWRFSFPAHGSRFVDAGMVPCDTRNLGFSGEQEKDNSGLELECRGVMFCVLPMVEKFVGDEQREGEWRVLVKASVKVE